MGFASVHLVNHVDPVTARAHRGDGTYFATLSDGSVEATVSDRDPERLIRLLQDAAREVARAIPAPGAESCWLCGGPDEPGVTTRVALHDGTLRLQHDVCAEAAS
jgi:hypothetical protein